tara:strand:- start:2304 stop:3305 length:1002 start_codon:yes stop_codon:yes gene_type:complete
MFIAVVGDPSTKPKGGNTMPVDVVAPGGSRGWYFFVGGVHVLLWVASIVLGVCAYEEAKAKITDEDVKSMFLLAPFACGGAVAAVALFSLFFPATCSNLYPAPVAGGLLLGVNALAIMSVFSVVVISSSVQFKDTHAFNLAVAAGSCVCLASMMVVSFYINCTRHGMPAPKTTNTKPTDTSMGSLWPSVLAPGGTLGQYVPVACIHALLWVAAIVLSTLAYYEVDHTANENLEMIFYDAPFQYGAVVALVVIHTLVYAFVQVGDYPVLSPVVGGLLLGVNALALMSAFSCVVLSSSAEFKGTHAFNMAMSAGSCVCLASMMVASFYVSFTQHS